MGIDLGLPRIRLLLHKLGDPHLSTWHAVHVAGTNGKGSICSYVSSVLTCSRIANGKFTSPHLVAANDAISLNGQPVPWETFDRVKRRVQDVDRRFLIRATEFEILTAVAFEIFRLEKVRLAVVEVGLGGRLDSTNVIPGYEARTIDGDEGDKGKVVVLRNGVVVTGIAKVLMDHENLLGLTVEMIAREKAGIIKKGVSCAVDGTNVPSVLEVIKKEAKKNEADLFVETSVKDDFKFTNLLLQKEELFDRTKSNVKVPLMGAYQYTNLAVSLRIIDQLKNIFSRSVNQEDTKLAEQITMSSIEKGIQNTKWPGRLQKLNIKYQKGKDINSTDSTIEVLIDGAHNESAAIELQKFINSEIQAGTLKAKLIFVVSMTSSKDITKVLEPLLADEKNQYKDSIVYLTNFDHATKVDGMPWIKSYDCQELKNSILQNVPAVKEENIKIEPSVENLFSEGLKSLPGSLNESSIVVCGSLYLAGEVLRLHLRNGGSVDDVY